jgi:FAD/FMN-containing dehydrogenase
MHALSELAHVAPPELAIFAGGPHQLVKEGATEPEEGAPFTFGITVVYQGTEEQATPVIRSLLELPLLANGLKPMSYLEAQAMSGIIPFGLRHYWKGHFLKELDDAAIDAIVDGLASAAGLTIILLEGLTGAARNEPAGGAAFGQRAARWNVSAIAIWEQASDDARQFGWARDLADSLRPSSLTGAGYANYSPADETPERVMAAYGPDRFDRLARVKRRYDPDNLFRFNHNIPPTPDRLDA